MLERKNVWILISCSVSSAHGPHSKQRMAPFFTFLFSTIFISMFFLHHICVYTYNHIYVHIYIHISIQAIYIIIFIWSPHLSLSLPVAHECRPPSMDPDTEPVVYNTSFSNHSRRGFVVLKSNWIHSAIYIIKNSSERQRLFWRENGGWPPRRPFKRYLQFFLMFSDIFFCGILLIFFLLFIFVTLTMKPYYPSGRGCFFLVVMFCSHLQKEMI